MREYSSFTSQGSALYDYLHEAGFKNFESYELKHDNSGWFLNGKGNPESLQVAQPVRLLSFLFRYNLKFKKIVRTFGCFSNFQAPQWSLDYLNCILNSGLLLEDHRHFIECYYPLETQKNDSTL